MELRQFKYFVRIVDLGSISRAAGALFIAQSALSHQLAKLEAELGCTLLRRGTRGVSLTLAGERFYESAVRVLQEVDELTLALQGDAIVPRGRVTLGVPSSVSYLCAGALIATVSQRLPNVLLNIQESTSASLPAALLAGHLDFAVMFSDDVVQGIDATTLFEESLFLAERRMPGSGDDLEPEIDIATLEGRRLAMTPPANTVRRLLDAACRSHGVRYQLAVEASSPTSILTAVRQGNVATVTPWSAARTWMDDPSLLIRRIRQPHLVRTVVMARPKDAPLNEATAAVLGILREILQELAPQ
ncbi:MAG: LysR family transcriptional regulator [Pigmentiphaga sp.]